jgi:UDP-glucose 4-epimerase
VIPQLIEKVQAAVGSGEGRIELQGDGSETRAFCYVDDIVDGIVAMWEKGETMNVYHIGSMEEVTIRQLAQVVASSVGVDVELVAGAAAEGGTPRRCPDIAKMRALGYEPAVSLAEGVERTARWYLANPKPADANALL